MTITKELIEVPEDTLLDVFATHEPIGSPVPWVCLEATCDWKQDQGVTWAEHLVQAVKDAATAAQNERLEHKPRDSRQGAYDPWGGQKHRVYDGN